MRGKIVFLLCGVIVLYIIVHLIYIRNNNIQKLDHKIENQKVMLQNLKNEQINLKAQKRELERTLASIPETILKGFKDPEANFFKFLDYVQASSLKKMNGSIQVSQLQAFKKNPVPLHESEFHFQFDMKSTTELERFLDYLLQQKDFPFQVRELKIHRRPKDYPKVSVRLALLLPAKIELPSLQKVTGNQ